MSRNICIRHAEPAGAAGLHALFSQASVFAGTLQLPYPSLAAWTRRLADMPAHVVQLVADEDHTVVGPLVSTSSSIRAVGTWRISAWRCNRIAGGRELAARC